MSQFLKDTSSLNPEQRAEFLKTAQSLSSAHESAAREGSTATPDLDAKVNLHFIVFVEKEGNLYQLDGRKSTPVNCGPSSPDTLLTDAVQVIQGFMNRDPSSVEFNMLALSEQ